MALEQVLDSAGPADTGININILQKLPLVAIISALLPIIIHHQHHHHLRHHYTIITNIYHLTITIITKGNILFVVLTTIQVLTLF